MKISVPFFIVLLFAGCSPSDNPDHGRATRTRQRLHYICKMIPLAEAEAAEAKLEDASKTTPPITLKELVQWLEQNTLLWRADRRIIDIKKKTIRDAWGREIILIAYDGKLAALGSKGPDGKWDAGKKDDIVVYLE